MSSNIPEINVYDWLTVGEIDCVVSQVRINSVPKELANKIGHCTVVFNEKKPTTHAVYWNGEIWDWCETGDYGGYAQESDPAVQQLKKGRYPPNVVYK